MKPTNLAKELGLDGVSERTLRPFLNALQDPPGTSVRTLVEVLFDTVRKLPRDRRDAHLQQFMVTSSAQIEATEHFKAADFALLPPARLRLNRYLEIPQLVCPDAMCRLESLSGLPNEVVMSEAVLSERTASLRKYMSASMDSYRSHHVGSDRSETNLGYLDLMLSMLHWEIGGGQVYMTSDALDEELRDATLSGALPAACLMAPYPSLFVAFTETGSSPLSLYNPTSGEHRMQGVFVYQSYTPYVPEYATSRKAASGEQLLQPGKPARTLSLVFLGAGKESPWDDTYNSFQLAIVDENEPLQSVIERHMRVYSTGCVLPDGTQLTPMPDVDKPLIRNGIEHLTKVLLYMASIGAQFETHRDHTEAMKQLKGKKNAAKLEKARARADRLLDYTVLGRGQARRYDVDRQLLSASSAAQERVNAAAATCTADTPVPADHGLFELLDVDDAAGWVEVPAVQSSAADKTRPEPITLRQRRTRWVSTKAPGGRPDLLH